MNADPKVGLTYGYQANPDAMVTSLARLTGKQSKDECQASCFASTKKMSRQRDSPYSTREITRLGLSSKRCHFSWLAATVQRRPDSKLTT